MFYFLSEQDLQDVYNVHDKTNPEYLSNLTNHVLLLFPYMIFTIRSIFNPSIHGQLLFTFIKNVSWSKTKTSELNPW